MWYDEQRMRDSRIHDPAQDLHTGHCRHQKEGTGTKEIDASYVLIWSGVCKEKRAVHGLGFIIQHDKAKNLVNTEFISERLLKISIREGNKINHYIQV